MELKDVCCPYCRICDEDASHLFFSCVKTMPLWWEMLSWLSTAGVFPEAPREHFLQHSYFNLNGIRQRRWQTWWISLTWCIWYHSNKIVFSNESFNGKKLMDDALFFYRTWLKIWKKDLTSLSIPGLATSRLGFVYMGELDYRFFFFVGILV